MGLAAEAREAAQKAAAGLPPSPGILPPAPTFQVLSLVISRESIAYTMAEELIQSVALRTHHPTPPHTRIERVPPRRKSLLSSSGSARSGSTLISMATSATLRDPSRLHITHQKGRTATTTPDPHRFTPSDRSRHCPFCFHSRNAEGAILTALFGTGPMSQKSLASTPLTTERSEAQGRSLYEARPVDQVSTPAWTMPISEEAPAQSHTYIHTV